MWSGLSVVFAGIALSVALGACQEIPRTACELEVAVSLEDGTPVEGAKSGVGYSIGVAPNPGGGFPKSTGERTEVISGPDGKSKLQFRPVGTYPNAMLTVEKEGFYKSEYQKLKWQQSRDNSTWTANLSAILKPIKNPIALKAKSGISIRIPEFNREFGFDLEEMNLVAPHGLGTSKDLLITVRGDRKTPDDSNIEAVIKFSHQNDGFKEFLTKDREEGSLLLSDHEAPAKGYDAEFTRTYHYQNGQRIDSASANMADRNYYFKVRTLIDPITKREISNYGKIYGDIRLLVTSRPGKPGVASLNFNYIYFNPSRDDRNIEFDVKNNHYKNSDVGRP